MPSRPAPKSRGSAFMDEVHAFKRRDWNPAWVERVRALCMALPEATEREQFGGPWWKAGGKPFCAYGAESVKDATGYHGVDGVQLNLTLLEQGELVKDPRFERARYVGSHGWTTMRWDEEPDWEEIRELVVDAYRKVANQRQRKALDASEQ